MNCRPDSTKPENFTESGPLFDQLIEKLNLAFQAHGAGDMVKAREIYEEVLEIVPEHPDTNYNLGLVFHRQGELERAMEKYRRTIAADANYYQAHYNLANALKEQGKVDEAIQSYRDALVVHPDHIGAHHNLGAAYFSKNMLPEAIASYQRVLALDPQNAQAYYNLGVALQTAGDRQQAIASYAKALTIDPEDGDSYFNLALLLKENGEYEEAIAAYRMAIELNPRDVDIHFNLGIAHADRQELEKAVECYRQVLAVEPGYAPAYSNLGVVRHRQGKIEEAIECYRRALDLGHNIKANGHILAALTGQNTDTAPPEYISNLFDCYTERFDHSLITELEYQVPMLLGQALSVVSHDKALFENALDLGCGTGLSGVPFRNHVKRLNGVDLSGRILEIAQGKNIYDALHRAGIVEFLETTSEQYDLFVAADVVIYCGNLRPLFEGVRKQARPAAFFALSTESYEGEGWQLRQSGRYAHAWSYIEGLAVENGFHVEWRRRTGIRKEKGEWINGDLAVLRLAG